jgi:hypothetical protein
MKRPFVFLITLSLFFIGCKKENDHNNKIVGTWYLTKRVFDRYTRVDAAIHTETEYSDNRYSLRLNSSGACFFKLTDAPGQQTTYLIDAQLLHIMLEDEYGRHIYLIKESTNSSLKLSRIIQLNDSRTETELTFKK